MMGSRSLRVLLVGDYENDPRLGSAKVLVKLREEITALGHTCDTVLADALPQSPRNRQWRQALAPALASRAITRAFDRGPYDVVDVSSAEGLWLAAAKKLGLLSRTAVIARSHGLEHLNYARMLDDARAGLITKPWTRRIWYPASRLSQVAAAARLADRMIVLNERDRSFVLRRGWKTPAHVRVVPHGVSPLFLENPPRPDEPRGRGALFCGTWDLVKGVTYLTEAWDRLLAAGRRVPLTVFGPGVPAESVLRAFSANARPLVTVVDRSSEAAVIEAYRRHDFLVFPSTYEGFGLVVIEAMSQGLPVIATPCGCASSLVEDRRTGLIVPPRHAAALATAVAEMTDDRALRSSVAEAARRHVAGMSWRHTAEATIGIYRDALAMPA